MFKGMQARAVGWQKLFVLAWVYGMGNIGSFAGLPVSSDHRGFSSTRLPTQTTASVAQAAMRGPAPLEQDTVTFWSDDRSIKLPLIFMETLP